MSLKTLPILFINLGGEMLYILDQRLKAQSINADKASRVMHEITATMYNKRFMEEMFKPQELYSRKAMRTVFDRLAHSSIMRLNSASMDRLYDLMTMAFKYQVSLCLRPNDILLVTLNHLDTIRSYVEGNATIRKQVEFVHALLIEHYASMSTGDFMLLRQTLLNFFQDIHIRVSIFLKEKAQNSNGRFVLPTDGQVGYGTEIPGTIRLFGSSGSQTKSLKFDAGGQYTLSPKEGSVDLHGDRVTKLGQSIYAISRQPEATVSCKQTTFVEPDLTNPNPQAMAHLDMLSKLIGAASERKTKKPEFRLNLFSTDAEEEQATTVRPMTDPGSRVLNIDASKNKQSAELSRIMGELTVAGSADDDDDLLELMDSAQ